MSTRRPAYSSDVVMVVQRISIIAKRLCEVETWRKLAQDLIEHSGDDIIKLEDRLDAIDAAVADREARLARVELLLGVGIDKREREVEG